MPSRIKQILERIPLAKGTKGEFGFGLVKYMVSIINKIPKSNMITPVVKKGGI